MEQFDVIISVGAKDVFIVKKNIIYINRHLHPRRIFLIIHSRFFRFYSSKFLLTNNITLIDESHVEQGLNIINIRNLVKSHFIHGMRAGWYFQQFLKMAFARSRYADGYYLIWDADTMPTSDIEFFDRNGRMVLTQKDEYHKAYFATMERLTGMGKTVDFSFIAEHMIIDVAIMQELICKIEHAMIDGTTWYEKIINATDPDESQAFSEFETYGTYIHNVYPERVAYRRLRTMRQAGFLFGRAIRPREIELFNDVIDTLSVEAGHIPPFPRNLYQYAQFAFLYLIKP